MENKELDIETQFRIFELAIRALPEGEDVIEFAQRLSGFITGRGVSVKTKRGDIAYFGQLEDESWLLFDPAEVLDAKESSQLRKNMKVRGTR